MELPQSQLDALLADVLENELDGVVSLLNHNGVDTAGLTKPQLQLAFLAALRESTSFRAQAADWMATLVRQAGTFANFGYWGEEGDDSPSDTPLPTGYSAPAPTVASGGGTTSTSGTKGSFWSALGTVASGENLNKLFGVGLDTLSAKLKANANAGSEERALELERLRLQQIQAANAGKAAGGGEGGAKTGLSTGAIIGIAAGGVLLVTVVLVVALRRS